MCPFVFSIIKKAFVYTKFQSDWLHQPIEALAWLISRASPPILMGCWSLSHLQHQHWWFEDQFGTQFHPLNMALFPFLCYLLFPSHMAAYLSLLPSSSFPIPVLAKAYSILFTQTPFHKANKYPLLCFVIAIPTSRYPEQMFFKSIAVGFFKLEVVQMISSQNCLGKFCICLLAVTFRKGIHMWTRGDDSPLW